MRKKCFQCAGELKPAQTRFSQMAKVNKSDSIYIDVIIPCQRCDQCGDECMTSEDSAVLEKLIREKAAEQGIEYTL